VNWWIVKAAVMSQVEARDGQLAAPMSYAGVARWTTRRSVACGTAAATAAGTPYYAAPGCQQLEKIYEQIVYCCP